MTLWPRYRSRRDITWGEVRFHLDKKARYETQFSSVVTWSLLSSQIDTGKKQGVRNLRVHVIFSPFLSRDTEVYKVTGLVKRYSLDQESYYEEEYLIRGPIRSTAIVSSFLGEGRDILIDIPFRSSTGTQSSLHYPQGSSPMVTIQMFQSTKSWTVFEARLADYTLKAPIISGAGFCWTCYQGANFSQSLIVNY
jgi:hypothetical protein